MKRIYEIHSHVTRDLLNTIEVDDLIKCNDWEKPMRVMAVTENYAVTYRNHFGKPMYSVIEKKECGFNRNDMVVGMFHCGTDNLIFGPNIDLTSKDECLEFLQDFEKGLIEMSVRRSVPIYGIQIKRSK